MRVAMSFLAAVGLCGCFLEARGGVDGARRRSASGHVATAVGIGGVGERQAGAAMLGFETSPLGGDRDAGAPTLAMMTIGGRYERSFTESHPGVRWYGRVMFGGNLCSLGDEMAPPKNGACSSPRVRRSAGVFSAGVGVALTATNPPKGMAMMDSMAGVNLGLVYTAATDEAQDDASFLGLELSVVLGGDFITDIVAGRDHD